MGAAEVASQPVHLAGKACLGAVGGVRDGGVQVASPELSPRRPAAAATLSSAVPVAFRPTPVALPPQGVAAVREAQ